MTLLHSHWARFGAAALWAYSLFFGGVAHCLHKYFSSDRLIGCRVTSVTSMGINLQPPPPRTLVRNVFAMSTHIIHYVPFRSSLCSVLSCFVLFCVCAGLICCCRRRRLHMRLRFLANVPFYHFCRPSYRYHYRATGSGRRGTALTSGQTNLLTMMNAKFVRVAYFTPSPLPAAPSPIPPPLSLFVCQFILLSRSSVHRKCRH